MLGNVLHYGPHSFTEIAKIKNTILFHQNALKFVLGVIVDILAKYLGQIGFTMIQTVYQIHEKLSPLLASVRVGRASVAPTLITVSLF